MRRWVWRILLAALVLTALTGSALAADPVTLDNGVVLEEDNNKWTVTGYTGEGGVLVIPDVYQGKAITKIAPRAFQSKAGKKVTEVIIPATMREVGEEAFAQCSGLSTVIFKDDENTSAATNFTIGRNAFQVCRQLSVLSLPQNRPAYIDVGAFKGCSQLNNVVLWRGTVNSWAFALCDSLKMVTVADKTNITNCDKTAFDEKTLEFIHFMGSSNDAVTGWLWSRSHFVSTNVVRSFDDADCTEPREPGQVEEEVRCDVKDCECSFSRTLTFPAPDHDYTEPAMPSGHKPCETWTWKYTVTCSRCGEGVEYEKEIAATADHQWVDDGAPTVTKPATCLEEGEKSTPQKCSECGEAGPAKVESIPKDDHKFTGKTSEYVIRPATCSEDPEKQGLAVVYKVCDTEGCGALNTCERCEEVQEELEEALKLGASEPIRIAIQNITTHIETDTADHPGGAELKELDRLAHTRPADLKPIPEESKPATCTEDGENVYPEYVCTICGETVPKGETEPVPKPEGGHDWVNLSENDQETYVKHATCTEAGVKRIGARKCARCDLIEAEKTETVAPLGHEWGSPVLEEGAPYKAPTCKEPGEGTGTITCTREGCGETQTGKLTLPALGHDWGEWKTTKEPTATESGTQERVCQREGCGEKETRTLPPLDPVDPDNPDNPDKPDNPDDPSTKPEDKTYKVDVVQASNGVTTVSRSTAKQGDLITVTVSPASGYVLDMIRVISSSQAVSLTDLGDGRFRFTMPAADVEVRATFYKTGSDYGSNWSDGFGNSGNGNRTDPRRTTDDLPVQIQEQPAPQAVTDQRMFTDVPTSHWAAAQINWASQMGYMSGSSGRFDPDGLITTQQMWMVLARLTGNNPASMTEARRWAELGGYADGSSPTGAVKRHQLVTALYRCARLTGRTARVPASLSGFADSRTVPAVAREAFTWALSRGVVNTDAEGRIKPNEKLTRAQFAVILYSYSHTV